MQDVINAINYLRTTGTKVSCLQAIDGDSGRIIIPLLYKGPVEFAREHIESVIDVGKITWSSISPRASDPNSLKLARNIEASISMDGEIPLESILPGSDTASDPFHEFVGRDRQKFLLKRMADAISAFGEGVLECRNLIFKGAPGTGKTSLGRALAAYCYQHGVTKAPSFVSVSAADVISAHVGETPKLVRHAFDRADGGVLMFDEAPSLTQGDGNEFGIECVNAINEAMDRLRSRVLVIAAGYQSEMDLFLSSNPGLASRFLYEVTFPDYADDDLAKIYRAFCSSNGFSLDEKAGTLLIEKVGSLRSMSGFANARSVRKLYDVTILTAAQNHPQSRTVTAADLESAFVEISALGVTRRVGFA